MKNASTAENHEWDGPYTAWSVDQESDACQCDSRYCTDCSPIDALLKTERHAKRPDHIFRLWLTWYRLKRWLFKPTPWSNR
jgi:hypothetical protein